MRVDVYGEELTTDIRVVEKQLEDGRKFYAIRFFLESSTFLHHTAQDDDRSAVTFWVPWTKEEGNDFEKLASILAQAAARAIVLQNDAEAIHKAHTTG